MKKIIFTIVVFLIVHCTLKIEDCMSQWQPDVRLTNYQAESQTSLNNAWCVASSGSFVHVVWFDERDGNDEIYYKRSTDAGVSWGADTRLTNNTSWSFLPSVAVSGTAVHVVWQDNRDGEYNYEIYYKRSTDAGISWGADTRLTNSSAYSEYPSLSVSGTVVHVVWHDYRDWNNEIYYKRSTDAGVSWGTDTRLTNNTAISQYPSIAVSGTAVHVVWQDNRDGVYNYEIYYKRSTDAGISWGADTRLTNNSDSSWTPSIAVSGSVVHVVWQDNRDENTEIYYKRSTDSGVSWGADTRLTNNSSVSAVPSVAVSGSVVHVVWEDHRDGNFEIYYKRDPTGNPIGIKNITSEIPSAYSLEQNYPNPFNPITNVRFEIANTPLNPLSRGEMISLKVFDITGKEVATLVNEQLAPGTYETTFDASMLTSGIYFYRLNAGDFSETRKMLLLK
jgi:hypothetical protein